LANREAGKGRVQVKALDPEKVAPFSFERGPVGCLLIHGFMGLPCVMRELGEYLAERDLTVLCRPLPGHSTTPYDLEQTDWHDWYQACKNDLDELRARCDKIFLCGLSMGGTLSLHLAAHYATERTILGVVTYGAPFKMKGAVFSMLPIGKKLMRFMRVGDKDCADPAGRAMAASYDRVPLRCVSSLIELIEHVKRDLQDVTAPALVFQSRNDHVITASSAKRILEHLGSKDKEFVEVDRSYHILPVDYDKQLVKEKTYEFIRRVVDSRME
jgi:carboxylesterase